MINVSTDKTLLQLDIIHQYLAKESYWAKDLSEAKLSRSISNSLCFGAYENGIQIGFARIITDYETFAYLCDVFVTPNNQGKGVGKLLMKTIMEEPNLQTIRRWSLATKDAHGLYEQFGFTALEFPQRNMEFKNKLVFDNAWLVD